MVFLYILLPLAILSAFIFFGLWRKEKRKRADDIVEQEHKKELNTAVEKEKNAQIDELNRTIKFLSQKVVDEKEQLQSWENKVVALGIAYDSVNEKVITHSADLNAIQEEKAALLEEKNRLLEAIEGSKTALSGLERELERLKSIQRVAVLEDWKDKDNNLWDLPLGNDEIELISILNKIKKDYPDIKVDISTIEWRKIWLPKLQDVGNREGLSCRGIYRLVLKSDEKVCYVGQAVNIQDRWYQHVKKMIGADTKGNEKLYNYRPEDLYWSVLEKGPQVDLNKSERYWIEYFGCKEIGLNKKL